MNEVSPGIFRLQVPIPNNPLEYTNVYLVRGDGRGAGRRGGRYLLVDVGMDTDEAFAALERQLGEIGAAFTAISQIVVTHAHMDHYGLAGRVKDLSGATLALHRIESESFATGRGGPGSAMFEQFERWLRANGFPLAELAQPHPGPAQGHRRFDKLATPDVILEDGDEVTAGDFLFRVIWTPGHAPGHVCLFDARHRVLLAGDHVLPVTTPNVSLRSPDGSPLSDFITSLKKVRDLDVGLILPAHEQSFTDLRGRIDELLRHHRQRLDEVLATLADGPVTAYQVSSGVTWMPETGGARFESLPYWDRRMAVGETLAHLEALRVEGAVEKIERAGVTYYRRTAGGKAGV